jgi:ribonucleoside-diphosphate reductase alpha chain
MDNSMFVNYLNKAEKDYIDQKAMGSQRILQFAGDVNNEGFEDPILKHEARVYNCVTTYVDRPEVFGEIFYLLLCGCGVGFSVQLQHVNKLPKIYKLEEGIIEHVIEDSIEGWADSAAILVASYFRTSLNDKWKDAYGKKVIFDSSKVRLKGSKISGGFKAPGPDGLMRSLNLIKNVIENRMSTEDFHDEKSMFFNKLVPIDVYDIIMHEADAVLSGGVRRAATIALFSKEDNLMLNAKTGNWFNDNPQRARSNISALLLRDKTTREDYDKIMESVIQFGEPGSIFTDDLDIIFNPLMLAA